MGFLVLPITVETFVRAGVSAAEQVSLALRAKAAWAVLGVYASSVRQGKPEDGKVFGAQAACAFEVRRGEVELSAGLEGEVWVDGNIRFILPLSIREGKWSWFKV